MHYSNIVMNYMWPKMKYKMMKYPNYILTCIQPIQLIVSQPCGRWGGWMVQPLHGLLPLISSASPCSFLGKHIWIQIRRYIRPKKKYSNVIRKYNCMVYFLSSLPLLLVLFLVNIFGLDTISGDIFGLRRNIQMLLENINA